MALRPCRVNLAQDRGPGGLLCRGAIGAMIPQHGLQADKKRDLFRARANRFSAAEDDNSPDAEGKPDKPRQGRDAGKKFLDHTPLPSRSFNLLVTARITFRTVVISSSARSAPMPRITASFLALKTSISVRPRPIAAAASA